MNLHNILFILLFLNTYPVFAQKNFFQYSGQYYHYGLHSLNGIRQTMSFHHDIANGFSIEGHLFTGSGRGKDISDSFQKDYILLSKGNKGNVPNPLAPFYSSPEGIHGYKRISNALKQDNGWGLSVHYDILKQKKLNIAFGIGYIVYNTKSIVRNTVMDIRISNPKSLGDTLSNYRIHYPATLYTDYQDGAVMSNVRICHTLSERIKSGLTFNVNRSLWNHRFDFGAGLNFIYVL
jgi:hypothetical protein